MPSFEAAAPISARNSSSLIGRRANPTTAVLGWIRRSRDSLRSAGMSFRWVRSPLAPKTTNVQGSAERSVTLPSRRGLGAVSSWAPAPASGVIAGQPPRSRRLHGVAAEFVPQGGEELPREGRRLARPEASLEGQRQDRRGDGALHRLDHGPASFSGVLDVVLHAVEAGVFPERLGREVEKPRADHAPVPPERRD